MDAKEEILQLKKLAGIEKMVALLEAIAFNTSSKMVEREIYLEGVYASGLPKPTKVHGDVRTQPAARPGEVPRHEPSAISRVQQHALLGPPKEEKS